MTRRQATDILTQISTSVPHFTPTLSVHTTTYPHVAPESLRPVPVDHNGRRKRVPGGGAGAGGATRDAYAPHVSPAKKRRVDDDGASVRTGTGGAGAGRGGGAKPKGAGGAGGPAARAKPRLMCVLFILVIICVHS